MTFKPDSNEPKPRSRLIGLDGRPAGKPLYRFRLAPEAIAFTVALWITIIAAVIYLWP